MKSITTLLGTALLLISSVNLQAATLNFDTLTVDGIVAADIMTGSSGNFFDWSSLDLTPSSYVDPAASITNDNTFNTYAFSNDNGAYVDLSFSTSIYNGVGADLAFFVVGSPATMDFSAVVSDAFGNSISISNDISAYDIQLSAILTVAGTDIPHSTVLIDLDNYGADVFGNNPLTNIRFNMGSEFGSPGLSLSGGIHTAPTVVPLPLPAVLFASGLGLLGFFGRKKH